MSQSNGAPTPAPSPLRSGEPPRRLHRAAAVIGVHLGALVLWELLVRLLQVKSFGLPAPSAILGSLGRPGYAWISNTLVTAAEVFGGYALAVAGGVTLALAFCWSRRLTLLAFPLLVTLNMVPKVALGPILIVWFSYGIGPNMLITFSLAFFPVLLTTLRGLREVEPDLLDLVRSLRGSRWQLFCHIQLPGALPYVFSGMKVAAILAVAGAVVGEFIASSRGLGYLMIQVQSSLDTPAMFMAVIVITVIGMALYGVVLGLERAWVARDARVQ